MFYTPDTMSSALYTAISSVLSGDNWKQWESDITSYLKATGLWEHATLHLYFWKTQTVPTVAATDSTPAIPATTHPVIKKESGYTADEKKEMKEWNREDVKCIGTITLRLSSSIRILTKDHSDSAKELWEWLKSEYDTPSVGAVFKDFNDAMNVVIPPKAHPQKAFDEIASHFSHMDNFGIGLEGHLEAVIVLSKLPTRYANVRQMYAQLGASELKKLTLGKVKLAVLNSYAGDSLPASNGGPSNVNKVTNVCCSNGAPNFNDQQKGRGKKGNQPQQPNQGQGDGDDSEKRKHKRGSGKNKKTKKNAHAHAADAEDEGSQSQSLQFSLVGCIFDFGPARTDLDPSTSDVRKHSIAPTHCPSTLGLKIHKKTRVTIE